MHDAAFSYIFFFIIISLLGSITNDVAMSVKMLFVDNFESIYLITRNLKFRIKSSIQLYILYIYRFMITSHTN